MAQKKTTGKCPGRGRQWLAGAPGIILGSAPPLLRRKGRGPGVLGVTTLAPLGFHPLRLAVDCGRLLLIAEDGDSGTDDHEKSEAETDDDGAT